MIAGKHIELNNKCVSPFIVVRCDSCTEINMILFTCFCYMWKTSMPSVYCNMVK